MEERKSWDMEIEPLLNTPEMERIQLEKLKRMLARRWETLASITVFTSTGRSSDLPLSEIPWVWPQMRT